MAIVAKPKLVVRVHKSEIEIDELRHFWVTNESHPNGEFDHFLLVCKLLPEVICPLVLSVWSGNRCCAVLAGRLEHTNFKPNLGYLLLPGIKGKRIVFIYQGMIGDCTAEVADVIAARVTGLLAEQVAQTVVFMLLSESNPLLNSITCLSSGILGMVRPYWAQHWELRLESEPGFLVKAMKSKHRSWFRRKERGFQVAFKDSIKWLWFSSFDDISDICAQMELVAVQTYQRGLQAGFEDTLIYRERLSLFARQGKLRIMLVKIDSKPAGFWLGTVSSGVFHSEATGYLPELQEHEIGTQMFIRLIDELAKEGAHRFDFGLGDAHYKKRFGDRSWRETTVRLFGNTTQGILLNVYVNGCESLNRALGGFVRWFSMTDRVKQLWRRKLAKRQIDASSLSEIRAKDEHEGGVGPQ